ncbi:hypothetical protein [Lacrimispora amygdalina]|uniref:hypothetical protein n=1 Tax=Lacrimispora amygdalina TaxID=253257 RepID=UPI000BE41E0A|nr:hypothetical protein [Lacrimispora amygdalina]
MTIKQCISKNGWQINTDTSQPYRSMDVSVNFNNGGLDETQFTINSYNVDELTKLFLEFCKENNIRQNTVTSITIVRVYEEKA